MGFGGELILKFNNFIVNESGNDIAVTETSYGSPSCNMYPEKVHVFASETGDEGSWEDLGTGCLDSEFDLGSLDWAQYVKLVDASDPEDFAGTVDGFDVDAVEALHCLSEWEVVDTRTTDETGFYCFETVEPGSYRIEEIMWDGWFNTTQLYNDIEVDTEPLVIDFGKRKKKGAEVPPLKIPLTYYGVKSHVLHYLGGGKRHKNTDRVFPMIKSTTSWLLVKRILGEKYYPHYLRLRKLSKIGTKYGAV